MNFVKPFVATPKVIKLACSSRGKTCNAGSRTDLHLAWTQNRLETDVVLSSGWMAFARHAGFLKAVEESGFFTVKVRYLSHAVVPASSNVP